MNKAGEHFRMRQRRELHESIQRAMSLDPEYAEQMTVSGWVLLIESVGMDDYTFEAISSDATGESDLRPHTAQGWCHIGAMESSMHFSSLDSEEEEEDNNDSR